MASKKIQNDKMSKKVVILMVAITLVVNVFICGYIFWRSNTLFSISFYDDKGSYLGVGIEANASADITEYVNNISTAKAGHTFINWYTDTSFTHIYYLPDKMPVGFINVYGKWSINNYNVTINYQDVGIENDVFSITYNESFESSEETLIIPTSTVDKVFVEYNTRSDGTGIAFTPTTLIRSATVIYAIWQIV